MAPVRVLLVDLEPAIEASADLDAVDTQARIDRNLARPRRLGYEADFCGTDEGTTAPDTLLSMLRAARYNCIVMSPSSDSRG